MKKVTLVSSGILLTVSAYNVGKFVGYIKGMSSAFNAVDKRFPGYKKLVVEKTANYIVDKVFDNNEHGEA